MINLALTSYLAADLPISYLRKEVFPENPYQVYLHILTALARIFTSPWSCKLHSQHFTRPWSPSRPARLAASWEEPNTHSVTSRLLGRQTPLVFISLALLTASSMAGRVDLAILKDPFEPKSCCDFPQERQWDSKCSSDRSHEEGTIIPSTVTQTNRSNVVNSYNPYPCSSCSFVALFPTTQVPSILWNIHDGAILSDWA